LETAQVNKARALVMIAGALCFMVAARSYEADAARQAAYAP
jgi:hypothetical protein